MSDELSEKSEEILNKTTKELSQMFTKAKHQEFAKGGLEVIKILRGVMKASGLKKIEPMWLDTAEKEIRGWNYL